MATKAIPSQGVKFSSGNGDGPPETFSECGEVTSIKGPGESAANIETTALRSTSREFIAGLRDGGEATLELNLDPSDTIQRRFRTDLAAGTKRTYRIELTDDAVTPTAIDFAAIVTAWPGPQIGVDEAITASVTLKVSGDVTYTYHAA